MRDHLAGYPTVIEAPVRWGDLDAFGHVNNTVFFRFFESARIEYLRAIAFDEGGGEGGVGPILASTHCRFRRPLGFPDTVRVGARTTDLAGDRFTMEYRIVSGATGEVAADGGGVVVAYDYGAGGKAAIPGEVRERILALGVVGAEDAE